MTKSRDEYLKDNYTRYNLCLDKEKDKELISLLDNARVKIDLFREIMRTEDD